MRSTSRPASGPAVLGAVAALVLSACTAIAAPEEQEVEVLRVAMADDWASAPAVEDVVTAFEEEHEGLRVEVQPSPFSQIPGLVGSAQEIGEPYDLAQWHAFAAAAAGLAEPVDALWERHGLDPREHLEGAIESVTWRGRRYGVPLDTNAMVLMARPAVLEQAGVDLDDLASADALLPVARRVVAEEAAPYALLVGASSWTAYGWIRALGGKLVEVDPETGQPTFTFDDPDTIRALELREQLVDEGLAPSPFSPDHASEGVQLFARGETALHAAGSWDLPTMARAHVDPEEVAVLPLPRGEGDTGTVLGGSSLFVPADAARPELAFELALALTRDEVALRLVREEGRLPTRHALFEDPRFPGSPDLAAFVAELPEADVMPLIAFPEIADAFREALEDSLSGRRETAEAMAAVQAFAERWQERGG